MNLIYKVTFEIVSPIAHPEYYCRGHGEHPVADPPSIPDEHWRSCEREGSLSSVLDQYNALMRQVKEGEFVRNVKFWTAPEPVWQAVDPWQASAADRSVAGGIGTTSGDQPW